MKKQLNYGRTARVFHWVIVALLVFQFPIGWLMPDIRSGAAPGSAMTIHISIGLLILLLIVLRFVWRLSHPVVPAGSLPRWQRVASEGLHWLLYALVFATTMTGWLFASFRGWHISFFFAVPLPMLTNSDANVGRLIGSWHQSAEWGLLVAIGIHATAALIHLFLIGDGVMQRMLPLARTFRS